MHLRQKFFSIVSTGFPMALKKHKQAHSSWNRIPLFVFIISLFLIVVYQYFTPSVSGERSVPVDIRTASASYGGVLVLGTVNPPTIINPVLTKNSVSTSLLSFMFDSLVRIDNKGRIVGDLAESWDVSQDGLEYIFHLKRGVKFHDGVECQAADVKFTYDLIADPKNDSPWRHEVTMVDAVWEVMDPYTIKLVLKMPDIYVLHKLIREIVPRHLWEGQDIRSMALNYQPVGTGPFRMKQWDRDTNKIVLEANQDYFQGRPYLDQIVIKVYPDNISLWTALMRQEVDFVKYLNKEDYLILSQDPTFRTYSVPSGIVCAVTYNFSDPIVSDINVRKAIAQGVDVQKIMRDSNTIGTRSLGPFEPEDPWFNPDVKSFPYDPVAAKKILTDNGWKERDKDGILERGGQALEIRILVNDKSEYYQKIARAFRQQLSELGIKVIVLSYKEEDELTEEYFSINKPQAWLRFFISHAYDAPSTFQHWYPASRLAGFWNYRNKEVDGLLASAQVAKDDNQRTRIFQKIHRIIFDDQPACFLFSPMTLHGVSAKFRNTDEFFSLEMPNYTIKDWIRGKNLSPALKGRFAGKEDLL
jgi:peptide/nickel transport system substrate-binding protein